MNAVIRNHVIGVLRKAAGSYTTDSPTKVPGTKGSGTDLKPMAAGESKSPGPVASTAAIKAAKSVSKKQQRFMGMVHATQKGDISAPSKEVAEVASSMSESDAKDFAETKHKGLPEKKKEGTWVTRNGKRVHISHRGKRKKKSKEKSSCNSTGGGGGMKTVRRVSGRGRVKRSAAIEFGEWMGEKVAFNMSSLLKGFGGGASATAAGAARPTGRPTPQPAPRPAPRPAQRPPSPAPPTPQAPTQGLGMTPPLNVQPPQVQGNPLAPTPMSAPPPMPQAPQVDLQDFSEPSGSFGLEGSIPPRDQLMQQAQGPGMFVGRSRSRPDEARVRDIRTNLAKTDPNLVRQRVQGAIRPGQSSFYKQFSARRFGEWMGEKVAFDMSSFLRGVQKPSMMAGQAAASAMGRGTPPMGGGTPPAAAPTPYKQQTPARPTGPRPGTMSLQQRAAGRAPRAGTAPAAPAAAPPQPPAQSGGMMGTMLGAGRQANQLMNPAAGLYGAYRQSQGSTGNVPTPTQPQRPTGPRQGQMSLEERARTRAPRAGQGPTPAPARIPTGLRNNQAGSAAGGYTGSPVTGYHPGAVPGMKRGSANDFAMKLAMLKVGPASMTMKLKKQREKDQAQQKLRQTI